MTTLVTPQVVANNVTYGINISGSAATATLATNATNATNANNATNATNANNATNATTATTATQVISGNWTMSASGTKLSFYYSGTKVFSIDSLGNIIAKNDIVGFDTP